MGFLTRCKRPFLFAFLLQFCNMLFSFFLKTFLILFEKQQLSAKPSTAERRQTLCAVQTLSGFPQRSFPAHKRAILRTSHTKLPFFDKQSRARMRWARLKFRLCRGDAVHAL